MAAGTAEAGAGAAAAAGLALICATALGAGAAACLCMAGDAAAAAGAEEAAAAELLVGAAAADFEGPCGVGFAREALAGGAFNVAGTLDAGATERPSSVSSVSNAGHPCWPIRRLFCHKSAHRR